MTDIKKTIRSNLKRLRERKNLSQRELSKLCNFEETYIGKIERGDNDPSLESIKRIAETLEVSPEVLFAPPPSSGSTGAGTEKREPMKSTPGKNRSYGSLADRRELTKLTMIPDEFELIDRQVTGKLLHQIRDGIFLFDLETAEIEYVNEAVCDRLGYSRPELLRKTLLDVEQRFETLDDFREVMNDISEGERFRGKHETKDGSLFSVEVEVSTLRINGEPYGLAVARDVSERQRRVKELKQSEQKFREIADNIDEVFFVFNNDLSELLYTNQAYEELTGKSLESFYDDPLSFIEAIHPDDRELIQRKMETVMNGEPAEAVVRGGVDVDFKRYARIKGIPVKNDSGEVIRIIGLAQDVTREQRVKESLREEKKKFRQFAENLDEVLWMVSPDDDEILFVSTAFEQILGRSLAELRKDRDLWFQSILEEDRSNVERFFEGTIDREKTVKYRIQRPDGEIRWIQDKAFPIKNDRGDVDRIAGIAEDITEELERQRDNQRREKLKSIGNLAASVMHEINNPTAAIRGNIEYLESACQKMENVITTSDVNQSSLKSVTGELDKVLESLKSSTDQIQTIVESVKQIAQQRLGEPEREYRLKYPCERIESIVERLLSERDFSVEVQFDCQVSGNVGLPITAKDFDSIFDHLVENALDAVSDTEDPRLEVRFLRDDEAFRIEVSDNGRGIPERNMTRITDPFFSTKGKAIGTGLGLSIVSSIVERVDGDLKIDSREDAGTTVSLNLPVSTETSGSG